MLRSTYILSYVYLSVYLAVCLYVLFKHMSIVDRCVFLSRLFLLTWHHSNVVEGRDKVTLRGAEVVGEEKRKPEEESIVRELEEAECDGVGSHSRDGKRLHGSSSNNE